VYDSPKDVPARRATTARLRVREYFMSLTP
jgi:hypothetical protein